MGCGCGKAKLPAERAAARATAEQRQAARKDPRTYWNGPPKKATSERKAR